MTDWGITDWRHVEWNRVENLADLCDGVRQRCWAVLNSQPNAAAILRSPYRGFIQQSHDVDYAGAYGLPVGSSPSTLQAALMLIGALFVRSHEAGATVGAVGDARPDDYFKGGTDQPDLYPDWEAVCKAAGLWKDHTHFGFRGWSYIDPATGDPSPEPVDWEDFDDPGWVWGAIARGDVIGPWIFRDIQKICNVLIWTWQLAYISEPAGDHDTLAWGHGGPGSGPFEPTWTPADTWAGVRAYAESAWPDVGIYLGPNGTFVLDNMLGFGGRTWEYTYTVGPPPFPPEQHSFDPPRYYPAGPIMTGPDAPCCIGGLASNDSVDFPTGASYFPMHSILVRRWGNASKYIPQMADCEVDVYVMPTAPTSGSASTEFQGNGDFDSGDEDKYVIILTASYAATDPPYVDAPVYNPSFDQTPTPIGFDNLDVQPVWPTAEPISNGDTTLAGWMIASSPAPFNLIRWTGFRQG